MNFHNQNIEQINHYLYFLHYFLIAFISVLCNGDILILYALVCPFAGWGVSNNINEVVEVFSTF